jgi:hypothetical protein
MSRASETAARYWWLQHSLFGSPSSASGHHHPGLRLQPLWGVGLQFGNFLADLMPAIDQC